MERGSVPALELTFSAYIGAKIVYTWILYTFIPVQVKKHHWGSSADLMTPSNEVKNLTHHWGVDL